MLLKWQRADLDPVNIGFFLMWEIRSLMPQDLGLCFPCWIGIGVDTRRESPLSFCSGIGTIYIVSLRGKTF